MSNLALRGLRKVLPFSMRRQLPPLWTGRLPAVLQPLTSLRAITPLLYSTDAAAALKEDSPLERLYTKINIKVKGSDYAVLDSYSRFVITAAKALDIDISGKVSLPTHTQKFTVLKSAHIYKKHRVQYEIRTHARLMQVKKITGTTTDIFLEYIQRNLPEGISMSVYQEELGALPALLMVPQEEKEQTATGGGRSKRKPVWKKK